MNKDILKGNWMQIRGQIKETWGKLTDDDLTQIDGNTDKLIGALEKRYGYSKDQAEQELNRFTSRMNRPNMNDRDLSH